MNNLDSRLRGNDGEKQIPLNPPFSRGKDKQVFGNYFPFSGNGSGLPGGTDSSATLNNIATST
jgi:hypothetical protein